MQISVVRPDELGSTEIDAWHVMQARSPGLANPFLCPEFAMAVGEARPQARVAVLSDGPEPAGFFPFELGKLGVGLPIGAGISDCQGLVHSPDLRVDADELLRGCGISVWHFDHLVSAEQPFSQFETASAASPVIDLVAGFGAYDEQLRARSPRLLSDLARKARKLGREVGPLRFEVSSLNPVDLRTLMSWKSDQYRRTGRTDRFDQPWIVEVVDALFGCRSDGLHCEGGFRGLLSMLYAGDKPVAGHFGLAHGGVLSEWFPAYDAEYSKYSPGLMQLMRMTEESAGFGATMIDLGKGEKRYKDQLKSYDLAVGEGTATGRSALSVMHRARLAPPRWAVRQIRANQGLFSVADRVLRRYGRLRVAVGDRHHDRHLSCGHAGMGGAPAGSDGRRAGRAAPAD